MSASCGEGASRTRSRRPYRAFGQILRRAAGIYENDGVDVARQKLGALVGSLFPEGEAADATSYLSLLLGLGVGGAGVGSDPPAVRGVAASWSCSRSGVRCSSCSKTCTGPTIRSWT